MDELNWARLPVGIDARQWLTCSTMRTVLVAVHSIVAGRRLLDIVDLVESDPRIQVVFTAAPEVFDADVPRFLRRIGAAVIPWQQATREWFDLALAASSSGVAGLHAPVLMLPHGAADGLSHQAQLNLLATHRPLAPAVAVVAGDPCYDRLCASLPRRDTYRAALGLQADQELVVATTTWGPRGLFGRFPEIVNDLPHALPRDRYRVAALLHPAIWAHGDRQLRAWLARACAAGLLLVEPTEDWRGVLIAADHVIGDQGSVTTYAAAIGRPVHYVDTGAALTPGSAQEYVRAHAPVWRPGVPIDRQAKPPLGLADAVRDRLTSCPGESHRLLRASMYRLLELTEPATAPVVEPVPCGGATVFRTCERRCR